MIGIATYFKGINLETARLIAGRKIIYLDLNYWIKLRNERKEHHDSNRRLYNIIKRLSDSKRCVFPISEITLYEILKQQDLSTREDTIRLVDELSEGVCMIDMKERMTLETRVWYLKYIGKDVYSMQELVWTRFIYGLFSNVLFSLPEFMRTETFLNLLSEKSLWDFIENRELFFTYKDDIEKFNYAFELHADENKTFQEMYLSELAGFIDVNSSRINDAISEEFYKRFGVYQTDEQIKFDGLPFFVFQCFMDGTITSELPIFDIPSKLYAWCRWIGKKFKDGNDTFDFYHASFALPYCDLFFTERRLCSGIKESKLDMRYNCKVIHKYDDVVNELISLSNEHDIRND